MRRRSMTSMNQSDLQAWLNRYVEAWRTNDREQVESLFTEDAAYRYRPYGGDSHANNGREAIVAAWLEDSGSAGQLGGELYALRGRWRSRGGGGHESLLRHRQGAGPDLP